MKILRLLTIVLFLFSCKKEEKKVIPWKLGELTFSTQCILATDFIKDGAPLKINIDSVLTNENRKYVEPLSKESFLSGNQILLENFKANAIADKAYFLDENRQIILLYHNKSEESINFRIQRDKENVEVDEIYFTDKLKGVLLKDLDKDGIKEIIMLRYYLSEESYSGNMYQVNVYSVVD